MEGKAKTSESGSVQVSQVASQPVPDLGSLIYVSNGNLPSLMAHTIQVAKMSQALSKLVTSFELVIGGDIASTFKGIDDAFQKWYGIHSRFKLTRLPMHRKIDDVFPIDYVNNFFYKAASLYTYLKCPTLVYTRSPQVMHFMLALQVPVLWEKHELLALPFPQRFKDCLAHKDFVGLVTLSEDTAQGYIEAGLSPEKVLIAHSGVDLESFRPSRKSQLLGKN